MAQLSIDPKQSEIFNRILLCLSNIFIDFRHMTNRLITYLEYLICIEQLWSVINARISVYYNPYAGVMRSDE